MANTSTTSVASVAASMRPGRILVANRGEIAQRVARTIQKCGLVPVTVHTPLESRVPRCGAISISVPSYLDSKSIIDAAKRSGSFALHPGYGFLSENADFAEAVGRAGLVWIGPPPAAMRLLADKRAARHAVARAGVPVLPSVEDSVGARNSLSDAALAMKAVSVVGFPAIVKPACGGGGKGMHIARTRDELVAAIATARREGKAAFGAGTGEALLIERYVENARHIEVQIFADKHGNIVHLGDRDCSVQRRNQKVVEMAPAPYLPDKVRNRLRAVAVEAARAAKYVGAGTVEFLVEDTGRFWFLEINARLQVEHPVTEMATGLDLVQWQIDVAMGRPLPIAQQRRIPFNGGCAVEARICAEDPHANYAPSAGRITRLRLPPPGPGLRVDAGVVEGDTVSVWYDPLIAKVVAWGATRADAVRRLGEALTHCQVSGIKTNIPLLRALTTSPNSPLVAGKPVHTNYLKKCGGALLAEDEKATACDPTFVAAALAAHAAAPALRGAYSPVQEATPSWRIGAAAQESKAGLDEVAWKPLHPAMQKERARICWLKDAPGSFVVSRTNGAVASAPRKVWASAPRADGSFDLQIDTLFYPSVSVVPGANSTYDIFSRLGKASVQKLDPVEEDILKAVAAADSGSGAKEIANVNIGAPLTARVAQVAAKVGDKVKSGQKLAILEAMKMEHTITSPCDGTVKCVNCAEGDIATQGDTLFTIN